MGKGRALLEFELVEEARKVHLSSNKVGGGVQLGLERWNSKIGGGRRLGGFLDVDPKTERMEELEWARILIKSDGGEHPGIVGRGRKRLLSDRLRGEVSGDVTPRAGSRVKVKVGVRDRDAASDGRRDVLSVAKRGYSRTASERKVQSQSGPRSGQWAPFKIFSPGLTDKNRNAFTENEFINYRVEEIGRRQQSVPPSQDTERMLEEEAARYGGLRPFWDAKGGGCDWRSGSRNPNVEDRIEKRNGCWDLVEINSVEPLGRKLGWMADQTEPQEGSKGGPTELGGE
ncbi:hypothetical protein CK203_031996 [Vitis vinifera]|uniref:DUF4283 domain-containing protein n=1 Tax=Vitis vinifera TaxID=29760 RepID=A0A438FNG2_VITVI|nr:hypothetical protein CK203_031996 [Vitis vinifera]